MWRTFPTIGAQTYCTSSGGNTTKEWINTFSLDTYVNNSGSNNGYGDFTSPAISLESGNSYSLDLVPGYSGKARSEYWRVWIDFNMDGDFTDNGELAFSADAKKGSVSGAITIASGLTGETRMRVSMEYNSAPASCDAFVFGEVEDYTLTFSPTAVTLQSFSATDQNTLWLAVLLVIVTLVAGSLLMWQNGRFRA